VRGEDHAGRVDPRLGLADDDDRVGRLVKVESVRGTELRRVGQGGIAAEQLIRDAQPRDDGVEPLSIVLSGHEGTVADRRPPRVDSIG
jgi:hypothetical protein